MPNGPDYLNKSEIILLICWVTYLSSDLLMTACDPLPCKAARVWCRYHGNPRNFASIICVSCLVNQLTFHVGKLAHQWVGMLVRWSWTQLNHVLYGTRNKKIWEKQASWQYLGGHNHHHCHHHHHRYHLSYHAVTSSAGEWSVAAGPPPCVWSHPTSCECRARQNPDALRSPRSISQPFNKLHNFTQIFHSTAFRCSF